MEGPSMRFSCSLPVDDIGEDGFLSIEGIGEMVRAMDRAGLDACFVTDHPAPSRRWLDHGGHATLDPFVVLTVAAAASPRIRLHTHILVLAYRNPFIVAKSAASLDAVSGGRMILGVAVGYHQPEFDTLGVPFDQRGAITDEGIAVMRKAWTGEPVAHQGRSFNARDAVVRPRPARPEGIPIWGGGNSRRAIRRAVELCDGWSPFPAPAWVTNFAGTDEL
jgi:probable F420-dependent oxidoreductase